MHVGERRDHAAVRPQARTRHGSGVVRGTGRLGGGDLASPVAVGERRGESVADGRKEGSFKAERDRDPCWIAVLRCWPVTSSTTLPSRL